MKRILIVDDELNLRESLVELVESENYSAIAAVDGAAALELLRRPDSKFAAILLDLKMPRLDGLGLLKILQTEKLTNAPVIVISAFGESSKMIEAMRLGAFDYVTKPLDISEILATLNRAIEAGRLSAEHEKSSAAVNEKPLDQPENEIIGTSRTMRDVFKQIGKLAATDATVLIAGESGTGKELVARSIHGHSARANKPFVAVNCGALPENLLESELFGHERGAFTGAERQRKGRFETAHGGTLFLDEIGELPLSAQVKLLRALQERRFERVGGMDTIAVDVRVIAATNRDLRREIEAGNFREDLFYRLAVIELYLPPLRTRIADIPILAEHFLEKTIAKHRLPNKFLSESAVRVLLDYNFRGNVRELENIIERAAVITNSEIILPENLFLSSPENPEILASKSWLNLPFHEAVAALERELITQALSQTKGNRSEAAKLLGINRRLLYSKLDEHKIV